MAVDNTTEMLGTAYAMTAFWVMSVLLYILESN